MTRLTQLASRFRTAVQEVDRFDTFLDAFHDTLKSGGIDGFYYWTYDRGALPTLLKGTAEGTGIVAAARGPLRLKPLETLYWRNTWYKHDPTLLASESRDTPFRTRDVTGSNGVKRTPFAGFLEAMAHFGITQDLYVPIHTPRRIQILYFFTLGDPAKSVLSGEENVTALTGLSFLFGNGIADFCRSRTGDAGTIGLTIREQECLSLTARGYSTAEIGDALGLKPRTAKFHVENMMRKLGARTRAQAVGNAARSFLLTE